MSKIKSYSKSPKWNFCFYRYSIKNAMYDPFFQSNQLEWKDKFHTPRCERLPLIKFNFLFFKLCITQGDDHYWERWLWIHEYNDGDEDKARETWKWKNTDGYSSWFYDDDNLRKNYDQIIRNNKMDDLLK